MNTKQILGRAIEHFNISQIVESDQSCGSILNHTAKILVFSFFGNFHLLDGINDIVVCDAEQVERTLIAGA